MIMEHTHSRLACELAHNYVSEFATIQLKPIAKMRCLKLKTLAASSTCAARARSSGRCGCGISYPPIMYVLFDFNTNANGMAENGLSTAWPTRNPAQTSRWRAICTRYYSIWIC